MVVRGWSRLIVLQPGELFTPREFRDVLAGPFRGTTVQANVIDIFLSLAEQSVGETPAAPQSHLTVVEHLQQSSGGGGGGGQLAEPAAQVAEGGGRGGGLSNACK